MAESKAQRKAHRETDAGAAPTGDGDAARRRSGLRAIAATVPKVTQRALGRRALGAAGLIADWAHIVGPEIATRCQPRRLVRAPRGGGEGGVLVLRIDAGFALEIQHLEPLLVERINGYYGRAAVARLRLIQTPGRRPPAARALAPAIDPAKETELIRRAKSLADPDLYDALLALGRAVAREKAAAADH